MKNNKYYLFILLLVHACVKPLPQDSIVIPPGFDVVPVLNKDGSEEKMLSEERNIYDQDIEDIKDLLLD